MFSFADPARRAREVQRAARRVEADFTLCDQFRQLRHPEIVTDQNIPARITNLDGTVPQPRGRVGERDITRGAALVQMPKLRREGVGYIGVMFIGLESALNFFK